MIVFDKERKIFHIQTANISYIIGLCGDYILEHLYWGKRIENIEGIKVLHATAAFTAFDVEYREADPESSISTEMISQEYSFFGSCDMRKPAFHAKYEDGSRITKMKYVSHKIYSGKPKLNGLPAVYIEDESEAETLEIIMRDEKTGLKLLYRYSAMYDYDALCRNVEVINEGNQKIDLQSVMSCNVDFSRNDFEFINLSGAWLRERHIERRTLHTGTTKIESRRGSSSHHQSPFFALADKGTDEEKGNVYGFSLVYSGNFEAGVEADTFGRTRAFMGINSFDFNWSLGQGEAFTAPEVVMVYSENGLGGMSRKYHNLYKNRLARGKWRDKERPILINNWEATYMSFDEEKIIDIAKSAKKAGIEMLVLDDGWFGVRNTSKTSLGDWYVNREKLPSGISGLAEKINALGLKFGLWFEPEMISPDSDLYRAHPDWCLHVEERGNSLCRNQLVLDLSRSDVQEYILSFMIENLSSANIQYVKWDMNRNMTCVGSAVLPADKQAEVSHRYMLGLYRILEELVTRFPDVLFEGCSGGGGRFDAGQMHYFNQYWTSDDSDAVERMYIQYGTSLVMPSCFMSAHVSAVPNHQVGRTTSFKTRGLVAMNGQFGYELDVTKMSDDELLEISVQIEDYKAIRDVVCKGDMYRLVSPFESNHMSCMYVNKEKEEAVVFYFTTQTTPQPMPTLLKLAGLDRNKNYRHKATGEIYSGDVLMNYGIEVQQNSDAASDMFVFTSEK